jgi:hypothetical protein
LKTSLLAPTATTFCSLCASPRSAPAPDRDGPPRCPFRELMSFERPRMLSASRRRLSRSPTSSRS